MAAATTHALKAQKRALRKMIGHTLDSLSPAALAAQSHAITRRVFDLPALRHSTSVSCYLSMSTGEAQTEALVEGLLASGKTFFVPKIFGKNGEMDFLRVYTTEDLAALPSGTWGIKEPGDTYGEEQRARVLGRPKEHLDIILVPGVAFDRTLSRLGHGKGYYDRFISAYVASGRPKPLLVGLGLREQLLGASEVPIDEHDWKLDVLITPDETLEATP